jgi:HD superfamily phosphohydrolase
MKVIRDNLHGDIEFHPEEMRLLQTAGFERLHGCRQLGLSHLIYPCAKHSRFEHVLGVMYVGNQIATRMREQGQCLGKPRGHDSDTTRPPTPGSRVTGKVPLVDSTFPISAFTRH